MGSVSSEKYDMFSVFLMSSMGDLLCVEDSRDADEDRLVRWCLDWEYTK